MKEIFDINNSNSAFHYFISLINVLFFILIPFSVMKIVLGRLLSLRINPLSTSFLRDVEI